MWHNEESDGIQDGGGGGADAMMFSFHLSDIVLVKPIILQVCLKLVYQRSR